MGPSKWDRRLGLALGSRSFLGWCPCYVCVMTTSNLRRKAYFTIQLIVRREGKSGQELGGRDHGRTLLPGLLLLACSIFL